MPHILGETLKRKWANHVKINEELWNLVRLLHRIPTKSISNENTRLGKHYKGLSAQNIHSSEHISMGM